MFKIYRFIVALVAIGLIGGAFGHQVDAAASAGDAKQTPKAEYNIIEQQESNHWQCMLQQFFGSWNSKPQQQDKVEKNNDRKQEKEQVKNPTEEKQETPKVEVEEKEVVETPNVEAKEEEASKEQTDSNLHPFEQQVIELTNNERAKLGLTPLKSDTELSIVARDKSKDMLDRQYFAHNSLTYGSPFDMMQAYGIDYRTAGENIAKGQRSPEEVVNAWMNSPGHRENIVSPNFTHIGVGYVEQGNIWTQMFIGK